MALFLVVLRAVVLFFLGVAFFLEGLSTGCAAIVILAGSGATATGASAIGSGAAMITDSGVELSTSVDTSVRLFNPYFKAYFLPNLC